MPEHTPEQWKQCLQALGKDPASAGYEGPPLFAPMIFAAASQIEASAPAEMACDATRLGKCLESTRSLLDLQVIYTAVPAAAEAQALGAETDGVNWPPKVLRGPGELVLQKDPGSILRGERIAVCIETTRRLAQAGDAVLIASITGPATLVSQLIENAAVDDIEDIYDHAGAALLALVRTLGEVGINAIHLQEVQCPLDENDENEIWRDTLAPITNVAKFHKLPVFMSFTGTHLNLNQWPPQIVPCPSEEQHNEHNNTHGCTLNADASAWPQLPQGQGLAIVLTEQEIDPGTKLAVLREHISKLMRT